MALRKAEQAAPWDQDNIVDWKPPNGSTCTLVTSISSGSNTATTQHEEQKPKISRWKSMFGRKPSRTPQQFPPYKTQAAKQTRKRSTTTPVTSRPAVSASKADATCSSKPDKNLSSCSGNTSPVGLGVPAVTLSPESETKLDDQRPAGRMLDIEIPNIQMERYSVMFGTVLQPAHPPVPQSLLVRRQGNTDRLKPLNELKVKPANELLRPQRRASSPSLARSPSFSPFPAVDSRASPAHQPKHLQRSQTAPGALSPNRAVFQTSNEAVASEMQTSQSTNSEILVATPTTTGTIDVYADYCLTPLSISVGEDPNYHRDSEDSRYETDLRPPPLLISKPPPSPASPASPTAQVSIARKVSVTRPRADSLRPMPIIRVGSGRFAGRKPRTPTLVEPLKRISQRVEVESA